MVVFTTAHLVVLVVIVQACIERALADHDQIRWLIRGLRRMSTSVDSLGVHTCSVVRTALHTWLAGLFLDAVGFTLVFTVRDSAFGGNLLLRLAC